MVFGQIDKASSFDFIYTDGMDVTFGTNQTGMTTIEHSYGLLVNTSSEDITLDDINSITFTSTSSVEGWSLFPFIGNLTLFAPIEPDEVVGGIGPDYSGISNNEVLLDSIQTGETFQNTGMQALAFSIQRDLDNTYEGDVYFDVTMEMSGEIATFQTIANMQFGSSGYVDFTSASRVSSTVVPEPISSTLFIAGGATLGFRRFRKKFKK